MADTTLHLSHFDLPPRRTVSLASMQLHPTGSAGFFEPWAGPAFAAEDIALCPHGGSEDHDAPGADCDCGFRATDDPQNLLDLINPPLEALAGAAVLDVELGGIVLPMGSGFRGGSQRVLGASVLRWCGPCLRADRPPETPPDLHGLSEAGWLHIVGRCDEHTPRSSIALTPDDVADHVHARVAWADPALAEAVQSHLERRWASPQLIGPLEARRRVAGLRMGHLGFVAPGALRIDGRGMLWVDRDAPAAQRPLGAAVLPVRRNVDLTLELIVNQPVAARLDARLARPRPPLLDVREEPVTRIRGRRHLPLLAAAVQL